MKYALLFIMAAFSHVLLKAQNLKTETALKDTAYRVFFQKADSNYTITVYRRDYEVLILSDTRKGIDTLMYDQQGFYGISHISDAVLAGDRFLLLLSNQVVCYFIAKQKIKGKWEPVIGAGLFTYTPEWIREAKIVSADEIRIEEAGMTTLVQLNYDAKRVTRQEIKKE